MDSVIDNLQIVMFYSIINVKISTIKFIIQKQSQRQTNHTDKLFQSYNN